MPFERIRGYGFVGEVTGVDFEVSAVQALPSGSPTRPAA